MQVVRYWFAFSFVIRVGHSVAANFSCIKARSGPPYQRHIMRSDCPLNFGLEVFGDKWSLLIIRDLMFFGKRYYNEFLTSAECISTNVLAERLTMLEKEKIIKKTKDPSHKQKLLYSLTEKGIDLAPVIINIGLWSEKYAKKLNPERDVILGAARKNYAQGLAQLKKRLYEEHVKGS